MHSRWRHCSLLILGGAALFSAALVAQAPLRRILSFSRAGTAYSAKVLCSGVLMAGMEADKIRREDLARGAQLIQTRIDRARQKVEASALLGLVKGEAIRQGNRGCSQQIADQELTMLPPLPRPVGRDPSGTAQPWPISPDASATPPRLNKTALEKALDQAFAETNKEQPKRTRAVVVVQSGWVVAERYGEGIRPDMPLIGWSMSKSLTHALIGLAIRDGWMNLNDRPAISAWSQPGDDRQRIGVDHLLRMNSGLAFDETTGELESDLVRMITQEADTGQFAASKPLVGRTGQDWAYASGSSNILSKALRTAMEDDQRYWRFPRQALFEPLGMHSAVLETDPSGTFVGSSLAWASARDWAKFGLLYLNQGRWNGTQLLPKDWVDHARSPSRGSKGRYGAHWWINRRLRKADWPRDSYSAEGYEGQLILIAPSSDAVIVRLGQTPEKAGFDSNAFGARVLKALASGSSRNQF